MSGVCLCAEDPEFLSTQSIMGDLTDPRLIWLKGGLFLLLGLISTGLLLADAPSLRMAALLAITVWSFCRAYYFAFYVIEHYVDAEYRFTGLLDFLIYMTGRKRGSR